jgi:hypothetical protein
MAGRSMLPGSTRGTRPSTHFEAKKEDVDTRDSAFGRPGYDGKEYEARPQTHNGCTKSSTGQTWAWPGGPRVSFVVVLPNSWMLVPKHEHDD